MNCIINVSHGAWYPAGARRQRESLGKVNYSGSSKYWINEYPEGCPPHSERPYAFKPYAFKWALKQGYDNVLWLDSAVWVQHDISPIFDQIEKDGYFVLQNGWTSGHWCSDKQLKAFGITREQAFEIDPLTKGAKIPHPMACVVGINIAKASGLSLYQEYIKNIDLFPGPWDNKDKSVSKDERVLGTRHDQAVLGLIMHKHKLKYTMPTGWVDYNINNPESILLTQGM